MTDPRQRFAQQSPTPQRTQVLAQQGWQPAPPPQGQWQPVQQWPYPPQGQQPQAGWAPQPHWPQQGQPGPVWPQPQWQPPFAQQGPRGEERNAAMIGYGGALIMPILIPVVLMLTARDKPFQRAAALQALIVQVGGMVVSMVAPLPTVAAIMTTRGAPSASWLLYLPMVIVGLWSLFFALVGARAALQGRVYYAPLIGRRLAKLFGAEWHS